MPLNRVYPRVGGETTGNASGVGGEMPLEVYPRVGGETSRRARWPACSEGLSPRGRGNPLAALSSRVRAGLSPRGRGNPQTVLAAKGGGLSPRGRGNLCVIMTQSRKRMNMSKIDGPTETHLPYGESGATRAARQVVLDGVAPQ